MPGADKWIVGNYMKVFNFFRVNYDRQNWFMLTQQLTFDFRVYFEPCLTNSRINFLNFTKILKKKKSFNVHDRVQIMDDVFYLINNQLLPITYGLNMLEYLPKENKYLPWKFSIGHIKKILNYIEDDSQVYSKFRVSLVIPRSIN